MDRSRRPGSGRYDYGGTGTGMARLVHDGIRMNVDFVGTGATPTGDNTHWYWDTNSQTVISYSDLTGADLTGAEGLDTVIWFNTICPDGTNSDGNGGTCIGHLTP